MTIAQTSKNQGIPLWQIQSNPIWLPAAEKRHGHENTSQIKVAEGELYADNPTLP